jgi:ABC-type proline/glycine betaine transport system substrate-binding protein
MSLGTSWAGRKNVIISEQSWTGSTVICQVMKYVLEKRLDIPVKVTQLNGSVTWVGMDKYRLNRTRESTPKEDHWT